MTPLTKFLWRGGGSNEMKDKNNFVLSVMRQYSVLSGKHQRCVSHHIFDRKRCCIFKVFKRITTNFFLNSIFLDSLWYKNRTNGYMKGERERESWQECGAWSSAHLPCPCRLPLRLDWTGWQEVRYPHRRCEKLNPSCTRLRSSAITHSLSGPPSTMTELKTGQMRLEMISSDL